MLLVCKSLRQLRFGELMAVYLEGNQENGREFYPELSPGEQVRQAEQDFYAYLQQNFFSREGDKYCIWEENEQYIAALRLQRFMDGWLLEALETRPDCRCRGYGERLIRAVQEMVGDARLYSHISPRNSSSLAVHVKCGFGKISDAARYADGSVDGRCGTYLYQKSAGP